LFVLFAYDVHRLDVLQLLLLLLLLIDVMMMMVVEVAVLVDVDENQLNVNVVDACVMMNDLLHDDDIRLLIL